MKQRWLIVGVVVLAVALVFGGVRKSLANDHSDGPQRKIVVFDDTVSDSASEDDLLDAVGGVKIKSLHLIHGAAVVLPDQAAAEALRNQPGILRIDDDAEVFASGKPGPSTPPAQVTPWGIAEVNAPTAWATTTGQGIAVGIIDTGIDLAHPDLAAHIKGGYNAIDPTASAADDNGHGTHVAGIVGAINNTIGVVGVGPGVDLYAIKVLNRRGTGYISDIITGLDWAVAHHMQVVNMSLGSSSDVQSFHDAIVAARNAGVVEVAAAGNSGGAVEYPGAYPEVIAVSAVDNTNTIASWSSRGPQVALTAPGVSIFSTYKGSSYQTLSGTSMAAPHVTGAAAMILSRPWVCDTNLDGVCSPAEVATRLESTATDLGTLGTDDLYGAGLVNVSAALGQ